jgi:hypothetical protein
MPSEKLTYNVPGCGNLTANIFPYTKSLIDFLNYYGHIDKLKNINQLGELRNVYPGAHHTRYEYVFLQLALISELCSNKKSDLGLSSPNSSCGSLRGLGVPPSNGELLQCLAILTNIGYLEGTISTSRAWLALLKENKNAFKTFKNGLEKKDQTGFERLVEDFDFGRFNLYTALFQLQRYKRKSPEIVKFASNVIRVYFSYETKDFNIIRLKGIYGKIRQISFITLDSLYTPVPFNLELSSILLGFNDLYESLFTKNATYSIALSTLENVLQDTIYLSVDSCLNTSVSSHKELLLLRSKLRSVSKISTLYNYLNPRKKSSISASEQEKEWHCEKKIFQEYHIARGKDELPEPLRNPVRWELDCQIRIGKSTSIIGLLTNKKSSNIKLAFGLKTKNINLAQRATLKVITEAIKFRKSFQSDYQNRKDEENRISMMTFLIKSIFGWNKRVLLNDKVKKASAYIMESGRTRFLEHLNNYLALSEGKLSDNERFEVKQLGQLVKHLQHSGLTIGYVGKTRLFNEGVNTECAEFDGLLFFPTKNPRNNFAFVIEAKNQSNGATYARKQLTTRLNENLNTGLSYDLFDLNKRCCVARIKIN